jgi:GAF domain-containing protein
MEAKPMNTQATMADKRTSDLRNKVVQGIIVLLMLMTIIVYAIALVSAVQVARRPFLGAFAEPTLVVNTVGKDAWIGRAAGLNLPDHLVELDGQPLTRPGALYERLDDYQVGDVVTLVVEQPEGDRRQVDVELQALPSMALVNFFIAPYILGLVYLLVGGMVFFARRGKASARAFPLFSVAFALSMGTLFDLYTTHRLAVAWVIGMALIGGSSIDLALVFPQRFRLARRWSWLPWSVYVPSGIIAIWALVATTNMERPWAYIPAWRPLFLYTVIGVVLWIAMLLLRWLRSKSPLVREQARIILLGVGVGFFPFAIWFLFASVNVTLSLHPILFAPLILLPLSVAYAILRYRLLDIDLLLSRTISYALLTLLIVLSYPLTIYLLGLLSGTSIEANHPLVVALFVLVVTLAFNPLREYLHSSIDRLFHRERIDYRQALEAYSHDLGRLMSQQDICTALADRIEAAVHPERLVFYIYDERLVQFVPVFSRGNVEEVRFSAQSGLVELLVDGHQRLYLLEGQPLPEELADEAPQMEAVGASLYLPLERHGWIALGEKCSGDPYTTDDLDYLEALADQTSLGIERVQLINDLERRVNELDALQWISQAVNFSVELDDLLELIYAQTSRVLHTANFNIVLYDESREMLSYAFCVAEEERYYPEESWSLGVGLASEVIREGQAIVTDDYKRECEKRRVPALNKDYTAWMGVPLNTGDQVVGVMSVSSSEPTVVYSPDQFKIFSAIADQAAAILDRSRLYEEMEERARQLATLNEVGSAVTSSLDLHIVLNLITEKAVEILDAEAGSLFLTDMDTEELVFQIAVGPSSSDLTGVRLPAGTGIVGAVAQSQEPTIVNDTQQDQRWFSGTDKSGGFETRSVLAVPLVTKGQSVGVLEVLNKKNRSAFDEQDKQLMMSFASQAAVAIENARLFTQTDQALADRVAELSMFQEIDHALNSTLDYQQVIELTLDWAMRMTGAEVGAVAILDEETEGLLLLADRGYPPEYERYREHPWNVDEGIVGRAVTTKKAILVDRVDEDPDYVVADTQVQSQLAVPIHLGDKVIGVINLESYEEAGFREDDLHFVNRLADRAVVPIENAQLYEQVRRANEAKSQFVSIVAHELKIPMTSIKGYARLLELAGESLDDTKKGFLKTITSNVDRMTKMVNDLLDISRIETGRLRLEMDKVAIPVVVHETLDAFRDNIEDKGLTLELSIPEDLPPAWGDHARLVQVLTNLVSNAVKYTPEGSIHITAETVELPVGDNRRNGNSNDGDNGPDAENGRFVRCSVHDTGIGISEEDQARLFKSQFVRFENAVDVAPGHGLGLWLVNRLAEMQGGQITFESELNEGSTFAFTIPVADSQTDGPD